MHRSARGWIARSPQWPALLALVAGCAATAPSASAPRASSEASAAPSASVAGRRTVPLDPGGLEAGTRYVMADLGLSIRPDVDGWFAVLPQGGDVAFSMGDVTV